MVVKKEIILLMLFYLHFLGCSTTNKPQMSNKMLLFKNYKQENTISLKILPSKTINFNDSIFVNEKILQHSEHGSKINGELFNVLTGLDLINQWSSYKESELNPYSYDYDTFINERRQDLKLEYLGNLNLSQKFNSLIILVSEGDNAYDIIKRVFLINIRNNEIVSITRLCNYTCFDGEANYIFSKKLTRDIFTQKEIVISSDVILPKEIQADDETAIIKFTYNNKGLLEVL